MDSFRDEPERLLATVVDKLTRPIVAAPDAEWTRETILASRDAEETVRLLVSEGVTEQLEWATKSWAVDLVADDDLVIREGSVIDVLVEGENTLGTVDRAPEPPRAYFESDADKDLTERWADADPVEIDVLGRAEYLNAGSQFGPDARETLEEALDVGTRGDVHPVSAFVWAGAVTECRLRDLVNTAADMGLTTQQTVYRHCDALLEAGLIESDSSADGSNGRLSEHLSTAIEIDDGPLPAGVREVLSWDR
jgi:hypothetical protein